jgi:thiamine kinase
MSAMESRTVELGAPFAVGGTSEMYAWDDGLALKLFRAGSPPAIARHEARVTRALRDAGVRVPFVGELLQVNGRLGLPMERLSGAPLSAQIFAQPESAARGGELAAELHADMHERKSDALPESRTLFSRLIGANARLPAELASSVVRTLERLPAGDRICHGDFHALNVFVTGHGPFVIDCATAHRGNPLADVAQTCVAMSEWLFHPASSEHVETVRTFIASYRARYFALRPGGEDELVDWTPVIAALRLSVPHPPSSDAPLLGLVGGGRC